jgi:peptide/nickel transport system permease protein
VSEVVFSYPGVGKLLVDSISRRDYPVIQGAALVVATLYVLVNIVTEISYAVIDPRLRR